MTCAGGEWGNASIVSGPALAFDGNIKRGYVVVRNGQYVEGDNANPIGTDLVGVALHDASAQDAEVQLAYIVPAQLFEAHYILVTGTDSTAAPATDIQNTYAINPHDAAASIQHACLSLGAPKVARSLQYARQIGPQQQFLGPFTVPTETYAAGSTVNARVRFVFTDGVFF
jgi:hypothetical protein